MDRERLLRERMELREQKKDLEKKLDVAVGMERRKLRVEIALLEESILDYSDKLRKIRNDDARTEKERKRRQITEIMSPVGGEDPNFAEILQHIFESNRQRKDECAGKRLCELAKSYRLQTDTLRQRIQLVSELHPKNNVEEKVWKNRLRILKSMHRETRNVAVICERYYDRSYHRDERYSL